MKGKEELSNIIAEGINKGFWKPVFYSAICILIIELIIVGLIFYGNYKQEKCIRDGTCKITATASPSCHPLSYLNCGIFGGNETDSAQIWNFNICGYQEANAKFEQLKSKLLKKTKEWNPTWEIKGLECN